MNHLTTMLSETPLWLGLDAIRAARQGPAAIQARQRQRLKDLVAFARQNSPYYRRLYQGLPDHV